MGTQQVRLEPLSTAGNDDGSVKMFADEPACPKDTSGTTLALPVLNGIGESCAVSFVGNTYVVPPAFTCTSKLRSLGRRASEGGSSFRNRSLRLNVPTPFFTSTFTVKSALPSSFCVSSVVRVQSDTSAVCVPVRCSLPVMGMGL